MSIQTADLTSRRCDASQWILAALAALSLAGCGGGAYIDIGDPYGPPPDISLAIAPTSAFPGQSLQLAAAVTASNGIDYVVFYRLGGAGAIRLGSVDSPPAQWTTSVPVNAGRSVSYFATVCDLARYCTDSAVVTINIF